MEWFKRTPAVDPADFWRETAEKRGGNVGFRTFARLLGRSGGRILDLPGLLYAVGDRIWFEDFERDNWLSRMLAGRQKFEKTELSFARSEVRFARLVSRGGAARCIRGAVAPERLSEARMLDRFFSTPAAQVGLADGSSLFFDIMERKEFFAFLSVR